MPPQRVSLDIPTDALQGFFVADDVFVIIALPDRAKGAAVFVDAFRGGGFE
jgi:hypothetical protein